MRTEQQQKHHNYTINMDKEDENKERKDKEDSKTNKKVKGYETRRSKAIAADEDTIIPAQPVKQPEDVVDSKKNKCTYKANKQGDNKTTVATKKLCIKEVQKMMILSCLLL